MVGRIAERSGGVQDRRKNAVSGNNARHYVRESGFPGARVTNNVAIFRAPTRWEVAPEKFIRPFKEGANILKAVETHQKIDILRKTGGVFSARAHTFVTRLHVCFEVLLRGGEGCQFSTNAVATSNQSSDRLVRLRNVIINVPGNPTQCNISFLRRGGIDNGQKRTV